MLAHNNGGKPQAPYSTCSLKLASLNQMQRWKKYLLLAFNADNIVVYFLWGNEMRGHFYGLAINSNPCYPILQGERRKTFLLAFHAKYSCKRDTNAHQQSWFQPTHLCFFFFFIRLEPVGEILLCRDREIKKN